MQWHNLYSLLALRGILSTKYSLFVKLNVLFSEEMLMKTPFKRLSRMCDYLEVNSDGIKLHQIYFCSNPLITLTTIYVEIGWLQWCGLTIAKSQHNIQRSNVFTDHVIPEPNLARDQRKINKSTDIRRESKNVHENYRKRVCSNANSQMAWDLYSGYERSIY